VLPQKVVAGAAATLAVLDSAGRMLPDAVVELSGGQKVTTDATGRALFTVPGEPGVLTARIPGHDASASAPIMKSADPEPQTSVESPSAVVRVLAVPHFISLHDRFAVEGAGFRGEADANRVFLSDQACLVLASSPVTLVVPESGGGATTRPEIPPVHPVAEARTRTATCSLRIGGLVPTAGTHQALIRGFLAIGSTS